MTTDYVLPHEQGHGYIEATPTRRPRLVERFMLLIRVQGEWIHGSGLLATASAAEDHLSAYPRAEAWRLVRIANLPLADHAEQV